MKKLLVFLSITVVLSCDTEDAPNCFQAAGTIVQRDFTMGKFTKITIEDDFQLLLRQGAEYSVIVESGENLFPDIAVTLEGDRMRFINNNRCNLFRDYNITKAIVTAPNIEEIRNSSAASVVSEGVLNYPNLLLISNTTAGVEDPKKVGDFILHLNCDALSVAANGQSAFYLSGSAAGANIGFLDEMPFFDGTNLQIGDLNIFQRSANKMIVNPQQSIRVKIYGTGDVVALNQPPIVEVEEFFTGRLLFQD
ncbi:MAG: head GIN domain-containing protein [Marinirhabdus sp.]